MVRVQHPQPEDVAGVRGRGAHGPLEPVESEGHRALGLEPEGFEEAKSQLLGLLPQRRGVFGVSPGLEEVGDRALDLEDIRLQFARRDRVVGKAALLVEDPVLGIAPALVAVAARAAWCVLLEPIAVAIPIAVDPFQASTRCTPSCGLPSGASPVFQNPSLVTLTPRTLARRRR